MSAKETFTYVESNFWKKNKQKYSYSALQMLRLKSIAGSVSKFLENEFSFLY